MAWKNRIAATRQFDSLSFATLQDLKRDANNWFCCSIGEKLQLPEVTKRDPQGAHTVLGDAVRKADPNLERLGLRFGRVVAHQKFGRARQIYAEIDKLLTPEICEKITKEYIRQRRKMRYDFAKVQKEYYEGTPFEDKERIL